MTLHLEMIDEPPIPIMGAPPPEVLSAIDAVVISSNPLGALVMAQGEHPPYTASVAEAVRFYGNGTSAPSMVLAAWMSWAAAMRLRDAMNAWRAAAAPPGGRPKTMEA